MSKILPIVLFLIVAIPSQALDLSGQWQSDSGEIIKIYPIDKGYFAYKTVSYIYGNGQPTGEEIHFHWLFKKRAKSNEFLGKLSTVDTHWQCEINNGDVQVNILDEDHVLLLYPQITFQRIERYAAREEVIETPIFCNYYSAWESFDYICSWQYQTVNVPKTKLSTECKITSKKIVPIELKRIN